MSPYILPFKQGDIIAELGGGDRPIFHPNIDIRGLPGVDIVADFNKPLPIPSESYNGIYSNYNLEHISWRSVNRFLNEIHRILKPGGMVVFVTANLLEQARLLVNSPSWNDNLICMLFGGQRFDEKVEFDEQWDGNAHHCGFSPEYITRLLKEIGFNDIRITPIQTDVGPTDMIVEAKKSINTNMIPPIDNIKNIKNNNNIKNTHPFNREYFEGGKYIGIGYQDFPIHYNTVKMILDRKPYSVIDIGGARGYLVKKLNDLDIPATCIDISEHCYHTRVTDNFVLHDLIKVPYPFEDKQFDLAVSISVLEYIPEDKIEPVLKEIARISKRGLHGITFESFQSDIDKAYINAKPIEWWKNKFKDTLSSYPNYTYEILDKKDTEKGMVNLPQPDNLVKLNIGSFINMCHHSWQNIDIIDLNDFARQCGYIFKQMDATKGLLYDDNSVDIIVSSHFLEHITREEGLNFLKRCYRILRHNGIIRLAVPDAELLAKKYIDNTIGEYRHVNIGVEESTDNVLSLFELLLSGHKTIYDYDSISKLLSNAGFTNLQRMEFNKSNSKEIEKQTIDMYPTLSLYVEAIKSNIIGTEIIKEYKDVKTEHIKTYSENIDRRQWILNRCKLGEKILDIGCADGWIFNNTPFRKYITSVDLDIYNFPGFIQMDAHNLELQDQSFDTVILCEILEHVDNPVQVLKEAKRVGKRILVTVPDEINWAKEYYPFETTEERMKRENTTLEQIVKVSNPNTKEFYTKDNHKHLFHNRYYTEDTLRQDLENAGIKDYEMIRLRYSGWSFFTIDTGYTKDLRLNKPIGDDTTCTETKGPIITEGPIFDTKGSSSRNTPLRIALISTPFFTVPPKGYGGLEQIVWDLAVELDELGHEVTIFGPEGSMIPAHGHLIVTGPSNNAVNVDWLKLEKENYERYKQYITSEKFDIIHDHSWFAFPYLSKINDSKLKILHTNHGGYSWESSPPVSHPNLVAISDFMKQYTIQYFKQIGYNVRCQYVHNGIDLDKYPFDPNVNKTKRLLYVGRFSKLKRPHMAIEVAKRANLPIDLVGGTFVDDVNYLKEIESMCNEDKIVIYKDVDHDFKIKKMQEAKCLIFPSKMGEPLGLVAQEAMACGTPVIAARDGAIPEVVLHNKTGFICDTEDEMVEAIKNIDKIAPSECRKRAEEFSRSKMAKDYEKLYHKILNGDEW